MTAYGYGKQHLEQDDIDAVVETLKSPYLTCGPKVKEFEDAICAYTGAKYCVAVNSATSGLHIAMMAAGIGAGDEAITTPITFLASANCARYCGADVVFADIDSKTANIDPEEIKKHVSDKTRVIVPVHFAGQSCDMEKISAVAKETEKKNKKSDEDENNLEKSVSIDFDEVSNEMEKYLYEEEMNNYQ